MNQPIDVIDPRRSLQTYAVVATEAEAERLCNLLPALDYNTRATDAESVLWPSEVLEGFGLVAQLPRDRATFEELARTASHFAHVRGPVGARWEGIAAGCAAALGV